MTIKLAARQLLTHSIFVRAALRFSRGAAPVFMLHRFADAEAGNGGHDPQVLRANLAWLRAEGFTVLALTDLLDRVAEGAPIDRTVAFTVDDGYADFGRVAAPLFEEHACPVTVFLTTGFLDGRLWLWWDRASLALQAMGRGEEATALVEALKKIPEAEKLRQIEALVLQSGVELAAKPTARFAPLAWDDVRRLSRRGVSFGPHSVTHPVLSRASDEQSSFEIAESWRRVRTEAGAGAIPVFCYPNGEAGDFGAREEQAIASGGMRVAMSTRRGYLSRHDVDAARPAAKWRLPRFAYSERHASFVQVASGIERAKLAVRSVIGLDS